MRKPTVVWIAVPVSMLGQVEDALRRHSLSVSDAAEELYYMGYPESYKIGKELQRKIDKILWQVVKKSKRVGHNGQQVQTWLKT